MLSSTFVIAIFCLYMGFLFWLALWAQRRSLTGRSPVNNPLIYSLSLAVYCSSWTFFGSVGLAANRGLLFMAIYIGPTLMLLFGGGIWRKLVRLKNIHRITSIADFISTRYGKSESLAALVTIIALLGTIPYVALQLKAVLASFAVVTAHEGGAHSWVGMHVSAIVVGLMILFTIMFGVRSLEPTERHGGMVMAVAAESIVKLVALAAAGVYVVYFVFDGTGDIFQRISESQATMKAAGAYSGNSVSLMTFVCYIIVSANAILCLPRQFHISVVENRAENHIRWAMCLFPLYLFILNLFIYPVAIGGLLKGFPLAQADTFVLQFPLETHNKAMALLVFIGGFSAATSMILICSMTMANMISNHLLLPLVDWIPQMIIIERRLLQCRWLAVAGFITLGYLFERFVVVSLPLADIGMLSFVAILQLAPALFIGLFWRGGNVKGVLWGLLVGFSVWAYTLLVPVFADGNWVSSELLSAGPWGVEWLRPQGLLGLDGLDPVAHSIFWSLALNLGCFIFGSLVTKASQESQSLAESFVGSGSTTLFPVSVKSQELVPLEDKRRKAMSLFSRYFPSDQASAMTAKAFKSAGLKGRDKASIAELAELYDYLEKTLAGSIGSATANRALARSGFFTHIEHEELREMYAEILADLTTQPAELKRRMDFYKEREALFEKHAAEQEEKVTELENEIRRRHKAERSLRESEERYRLAIESSNDGVIVVRDLLIVWGNTRMAEIFGYKKKEDLLGKPLSTIVHPDDQSRVLDISRNRQRGESVPRRYDFKGQKQGGDLLYVAVSATTMFYHGETLILAYLRDVTQRRLAEEQVHHLSQRLIDGIEEERRRLAADLHDEFGQAMTGLHLGMESLINALQPDQETIQKKGHKLIDLIEHLADSLRSLTTELRPDMLDHLGLVPTVEWYVNDFRERAIKPSIRFEAAGFGERKLPGHIEIVLYRILQEALNNVVKHAQANEVTVRLTYNHPRVIMIISDNGRGFQMDSPSLPSPAGKGGIGLISMRERVASVGGTIDVRSTVGGGTVIKATIPVVSTSDLNPAEFEDRRAGVGKAV
jgi:PAS domain S-box-containing protein